MQKNSGFTIMELMIVLAIMAIVAGFALPNMIGWRGDAKFRGTVANLKGDLNAAKMMAVRENAFVVVNFIDANSYEVFVDNGASSDDWTWQADERRLVNRVLPAGVTIDLVDTDLDSDRTRFNRRGLPENIGNIEVESTDGATQVITLNRLGRIIVP